MDNGYLNDNDHSDTGFFFWRICDLGMSHRHPLSSTLSLA